MRLLDHLLVAALHAAVAHADRPHRAVTIGDQLHLDVPGPGDDPLHEHGRVAEGLEALGPGAVERFGEAGSIVDLANATTAAARCRLDHQREPDLLGVSAGVLDRVDRPATPRRDGHAGLLGQQLGADLVAEPAHHIGARTDEDDAEVDAELGELGPFGDEPPTHPRRIGTRRDAALAAAPRGRGMDYRRRMLSLRRCRPPRLPHARTSRFARLACAARWCERRSRARGGARARR